MFKLFQTDKAQEAEDKEQRRKEKELKKKEKEEKKREKELQKEKRKSFTSPEPDRDGESSSARKLKSEARNEDSPMKLRESTSSSTANTSKAESSPESSKMESVVGPTNSSILQEPQPTTNNPPSYETFVAAAAATIPKLENNLSNDSSELAEEPKKDIIAEVKQKAIENLQPKASVKVSQLFLDSVQLRFLVPSAFGFGFFVAYFFGYIGFPLFGVLIVMWCFQKIDNLRQDREWIAKFNMLENERKRKEQEIASNSSKESVEWMNTVVDKFWERVSPTVIAIVMEQTKQAIEKQFAQSKPAGLSDLVLEDMDLGTTPPRINFMKSYQGLSKDVYQLDVSYSYAGEIRVVVTVKVGFGLAAIPVPILVDNISISGLAKIELQLAHQVPFIKKLKLQLQDSDMDVSVHPLKALDVLNLPLLHDWILNTVSKALENTVIEVDLMPDDKCGKLQTEDEKRGNKLTSAVSSVGKGFVAVGEGVGKGVVAVGEGFVAVGEGFGKGAVTVGKGMVTGVEEVGKGVGKVGSTLGKGVGKMGRGVGKIGKKVVTLGKSQDGSDEEDEEIDQAQSETSQPVGTI